MRKITIITILLITVIIFTACGKDRPKKITGLIIPGCEELALDLRNNNPNAANNEVYKAAADILFSDNRPEEAKLCCANIIDQKVRGKCEKREEE